MKRKLHRYLHTQWKILFEQLNTNLIVAIKYVGIVVNKLHVIANSVLYHSLIFIVQKGNFNQPEFYTYPNLRINKSKRCRTTTCTSQHIRVNNSLNCTYYDRVGCSRVYMQRAHTLHVHFNVL